ncbi:Ectonucleoside triphosphate diphosphohydrolase 7 [Halotydeus destructor]|nr:Ectonucleoside triphosphate diphosphohydrolase 7 [Halotydeus destructor]
MSHALRQTKAATFVRPLHRLVTGRVRLFLLVGILLFIIVFTARTLNSRNIDVYNEMSNVEFNDNIVDIKDYLRYAVLIDAGSSGSRVHIYTWPPHSGDKRQLLKIRYLKDENGKDVAKRINPGLSSCSKEPSSSSEYIRPLIDFAARSVPSSKHHETPLFILATAGMRLLDKSTQEAILDNLRRDIPKNHSFHFPPNHAQVITGKEEGIYSWITVNYLMGRFDHSVNAEQPVAINLNNSPITTRQRTIGMLEMGGASVQIAFEVTSKYELNEIKARSGLKTESEQQNGFLAQFNLGCSSHDTDHSYLLYVTTFLGLGANTARETYLRALLDSIIFKQVNLTGSTKVPSGVQTKRSIVLVDPCLAKDSYEIVNLTSSVNNQTYELETKGAGNYDVCRTKLLEILDPKREVDQKCSSGNSSNSCPLRQLQKTRVSFSDSEFYGFSELWYTLNDVLGLGGQYDYFKFKKAAADYCGLPLSTLESRYDRKLYPKADMDRLVHQCFKSVWVMALLHDGFRMPTAYKSYKSVSSVNGNTVQWTLGALLYRTRFFPQGAIEKAHGLPNDHAQIMHAPATYSISSYYINHLLFVMCMGAVIVSIGVYLKTLNKMVNSHSSLIGINVSDTRQKLPDMEPLLDSVTSA